MFFLDTQQNVNLSDAEYHFVFSMARKYDIELDNLHIVKNKGLSYHNNVACFSILHPFTLFICSDQSDMMSMMPYIAHEAKHHEQYERMGLFIYTILSNPLWRNWTIEQEAYAEEDRVQWLITH